MRPFPVFTAFSLCAAMAAFGQNSGQKKSGPDTVVVTNSTAQPVPVTGNVNATITASTVPVTGTVNANVTNTPNVSIANTPSVNVTSLPPISLSGAAVTIDPATTVHTADTAGREIVRLSTWMSLSPGFSGQAIAATLTDGTTQFTVPDGKRMVINHISVWAQMPAGQVPLVAVTASGITAWPEMHAAYDGKYVGSSSTPFYADGGSVVSLWFERSPYQVTGTPEARIQVSGYLIECGSGCLAIQ